ncbi:MAG: helix-turn-helix domain-containing protein [Myxococcota bacterium]
MGRPSGDPAAVRERILEAAIRLFGERGFDGVSVRRVGEGAGVTFTTVHHHFGSKRALYAACLERMGARFRTLAGRLAGVATASPDGPVEPVIEAMVRESFRFAREHQGEIRLILRDVIALEDIYGQRQRAFSDPLLQMGAQLLAPRLGREPNELRIDLHFASFAIVRTSIASDEEMTVVSGEAAFDDALRAYEDGLVRNVLRMLVR